MPGATQLGILRKIFLDRYEWWHLVPDQAVFHSGGKTSGQILNLAARHKDGKWIIAYLGTKSSFSINMNKLVSGKTVSTFWIDPRNGKPKPIEGVARTGVQSLTTPAGWEDAVLVIETAEAVPAPA